MTGKHSVRAGFRHSAAVGDGDSGGDSGQADGALRLVAGASRGGAARLGHRRAEFSPTVATVRVATTELSLGRTSNAA